MRERVYRSQLLWKSEGALAGSIFANLVANHCRASEAYLFYNGDDQLSVHGRRSATALSDYNNNMTSFTPLYRLPLL